MHSPLYSPLCIVRAYRDMRLSFIGGLTVFRTEAARAGAGVNLLRSLSPLLGVLIYLPCLVPILSRGHAMSSTC